MDSTGRQHEIVILRHGETEWSRSGRHTGLTDLLLTENGEAGAVAAGVAAGAGVRAGPGASPLQRARRTAEFAGLTPQIDAELLEWDYGGW